MPIGGFSQDGVDEGSPDATDPTGRLEANGGFGTLNDVLTALANPRRRIVLYYLQTEKRATVDDLARQIAARELQRPPEAIPADERDRIATELVHVHLPQLADALFIEYDPRSMVVTYTEPPALLDKILEVLAQLEAEHRA